MAAIVMGLGTSHGSQVSLTPDWWPKHGELDRARTNYDELIRDRSTRVDDEELSPEVMQRKYDDVQRALGALRQTLADQTPDVLVVVGDDQAELFQTVNMPAIALFWGETILDIPRDLTHVPESRRAAMWAKHADHEEAYPVPAEFGRHVVEQVVADGFDMTQMSLQPDGRSVGHAFTFVRLRLMADRIIPMLPLMINTYFPPNQPRAARCLALGRALRRAIESWEEPLRVGIVASGGLSHFVVDEALDRKVLAAIESGKTDELGEIAESDLQSGSSEIKNWIVAAGALEGLAFELVGYVPGYRTPAGTGCGMAFARWA